ncbi:MAG: beta-N-acetylhexosaminidase [Gammaproteobacteria bacterium]|nr:beta-N-acetylhexosaminidase [Gammaproteobacteria bacterium]
MSGPIMVDIAGLELQPEDHEILAHPLTGGVILFSRNYADPVQLRQLVCDIHKVKSPGLIVAVDQEGGRVQRFRDGFTAIPPMASFGRLFDRDPYRARQLTEDCGWVIASELREAGIDLNFAPVIDLDYGCSEVIGDRAFHREAEVVAALAGALIRGMRSAGIATCAKHFPGHGAIAGDSHLELPTDPRSRADIDRDMEPFRRLIELGVESIMTAHLVVSCLDHDPVSFSTSWLQDILRTRLGFTGIVFSDDLTMEGADCAGGIVEKARRAIAAGCDFLPVCNDRNAVEELYSQTSQMPVGMDFAALRGAVNTLDNFKKTRRYKGFVKHLQAEMQDLSN